MKSGERALYMLLAFAAGLLGGVSASHLSRAIAAKQPPAAPSVITTHKLVIVDKDGKNRAEFGTELDRPAVSIVMYDAKGKRRLGVGAEENGAGLNIFERDGKTLRLALHLKPDDVTGLTLYTADGKPVAGIAISALGTPGTP